MKHELLVPVGNKESLIYAINNGADAVYLAGKKYGARAFAENFTLEEIEEATNLCHLYGVKIFITVNTLIYESEFSSCLEYIESLHKIGVDALILQDIGLIEVVHSMFPNLEIHASTQMHNHSKENIKFLESLGVKRVVFARELPLDFINNLDTTMEKEAFIHGSLCISYSGQCYFSKCILNRSANRGECAGMCRLKYNLLEDGRIVNNSDKYLLSPKDLCSVENFKELMNSNIYSFKIEGRMKSPAYVGIVTKIYRKLIDDYESGKELQVSQSDLDELKSIFYRGYTPGFLFNNEDIMNYESSNHIGLYAGKITKVTPKKLAIKLDIDLKQGDSIRIKNINKGITLNFIYDSKDNLIKSGTKGTTIYLDNFLNLTKEDEIYLTSPKLPLETNITKKITVSMNFTAKLNEKIKLEVSDGINNITIYGAEPSEAINQPITKENIEKSLTKTGTTPYKVSSLNINISGNLFIRNIDLNNLRREALEELSLKRMKASKEFIKNNYQENLQNISKTKEIYVLARTKEQITVLKKYPVKIIVDKLDLLEPTFIYKIPRNLLTYPKYNEKVLNTSYASMIENSGNISDYFLNITNHYALNLAHKYNTMVTLSFENDFNELKSIMNNYPSSNTGLLVYGKIELMMIKECLLKNTFKAKSCHICKYNKTYKLIDRNKEEYEILTSPQAHTSYILNCHTTNLINKIPTYQELGITNFRVDLSSETAEDTVNIIEQIISKININS